MKFGIVILGALILLLLTGVIPVGHELSATAVYYSPVMMMLFALLIGSLVWACFKRTFSVKQVGFYLVHLGVVLILVGAFIGYLVGVKGTLQLFLMPSSPETQGLTHDGDVFDLGFDVAAKDFEVEFYPLVYQLYVPLPPEKIEPGKMPFEKAGEFRVEGREILNVGELQVSVSNLLQHGQWVERVRLEDRSILVRGQRTPSHFGVTLVINETTLPVRINHPADYNGWRFYLESYDSANQSYVVVLARRDPGRQIVIAGIWMLLIGSFVICMRKQGVEV